MATDALWADELETAHGVGVGVDLWGMIWRRKWAIATCVVLGTIGGFLYYYSATPHFRSAANVLIERKQPPMQGTGSAHFNHFAAITDKMKHPIVMRSPEVALSAFTDHRLDTCPSLSDYGDILATLDIQPVQEGLGVYEVSFEGTNRQDTAKIVNAVLDAYRGFLEDSHRNVGQETRELITRGKEELLRQLEAKESAYAEFRADAPLMWKDGTATNLHQQRQLAIEATRAEIQLKISNYESELAAIKKSLSRGENLDGILFSAIAEIGAGVTRPVSKIEQTKQRQLLIKQSKQARMSKEHSMLIPLKLREEELTAKFAQDHPKVKSIRRSIRQTQTYLAAEDSLIQFEDLDLNAVRIAESRRLSDWRNSTIRGYVDSLRQKLSSAGEEYRELDSLFKAEEVMAKKLARFEATDESHRNNINRTKSLFDSVVKNLEQIDLNDSDGYNFSVISPALPGRKVSPRVPKTFGLSIILGGLVGTGIGFLLEKKDQSFRSPVEISQVLRMPVIGNIPVIELADEDRPESSEALESVLCTAHEPRSQEAEAYRTVRTAIFFDARGSKHHVLQVTSPRPGDGKSTLAANLAITVAQGGKKTLLIDADFRRPTAHKVFGFKQKKGMAALVQGKVEPSEVLHRIECVPNLTVVPCGLRPLNPSELLSSKEFASTIDYLKERFDFVIIDTPPLLAVSDPRAVAASVDGIVLTMRIDKEARPVAKRAVEILREAGANVVGIVVNGVNGGIDKKERNAYYDYGAHTYGYNAYKYGYGQAYGYGDDYEEDEADDDAALSGATSN